MLFQLTVTDNHIENILSITMFQTASNWKYLTEDRNWENQTYGLYFVFNKCVGIKKLDNKIYY